jgi:hypothetical protein
MHLSTGSKDLRGSDNRELASATVTTVEVVRRRDGRSTSRGLRPLVKASGRAGQGEVDHGKFGHGVDHQSVVTGVEVSVSVVVDASEGAKSQVEGSGLGRATGDAVETLVVDQRLLGVGRRSELTGDEAEGGVIRGDVASVVDVDSNVLESAAVLVGLSAARQQGGNVVGRLGQGRNVGSELGVVHAVAELEDSGAVVPLVGSAGRASGLVRAESHVSHGDVRDVVSRVLSDRKTTSRCDLSGDDVDKSNTTILTRVATPQDSGDVRVVDERSVIELVTHLGKNHRLAVQGELADDIELGTGPVDSLTIHTLGLDTDVKTTDVDDDISLLSSSPDRKPVVSGGITLATGSSSIEDLGTSLLKSVQRAVEVGRDTVVVTLHLRSSVGPASDDGNLGSVGDGKRKQTIVLQESDTLLSGLESELLSVGSADIGPGQVSVHGVGTIEVSSADERSVQTDERLVNGGLVDQTLAVGQRKVVLVVGTTVEISTGVEGSSGSSLAGVAVVVGQEDVLDRITITGNPLLLVGPVPVLTEDVVQQPRIGTGGNAVQSAVCAHESSNVGVSGARAERRQVVLDQITLTDLDIVLVTEVTVPRLDIVTGEMLASSGDLSDLRILATLETHDKGVNVGRKMVRVFSRSFLTSAPSGISVRVDV